MASSGEPLATSVPPATSMPTVSLTTWLEGFWYLPVSSEDKDPTMYFCSEGCLLMLDYSPGEVYLDRYVRSYRQSHDYAACHCGSLPPRLVNIEDEHDLNAIPVLLPITRDGETAAGLRAVLGSTWGEEVECHYCRGGATHYHYRAEIEDQNEPQVVPICGCVLLETLAAITIGPPITEA